MGCAKQPWCHFCFVFCVCQRTNALWGTGNETLYETSVVDGFDGLILRKSKADNFFFSPKQCDDVLIVCLVH